MDFSNRNTVSPSTPPVQHEQAPVQTVNTNHKPSLRRGHNKWMDISAVVLLFGVVILAIGVIAYIAFGNNVVDDQYSYVNTSKLQAIFLESGQVYFGNIKSINNKYYVLRNIYYLQTTSGSSSTAATTSTASTSSSVSLVKLGCELHAPYDLMVINADQVTFWENLQSTGQVATAVAAFQKENPDGQKCSDQTASSSATSSSVQNAGTATTTPTTTTPTTNTTK